MTEVTPGYVKVLFGQLVKLAGGVEAAGLILGISNQRVSQLQSLNCGDMPSIIQMATLQIAIEQPVMTEALTGLVTGVRAARDLQKETREALHATCDLDRAVAENAPPKAIDDALARAQRELNDVAHLRAANQT